MVERALKFNDKIGERQFRRQREQLEKEIAALATTERALATVGLYFGGAPVFGSKGIMADFAGNALANFQSVVSKSFAATENGELGARGRIPQRDMTHLMVTGVARGSFGFVLEEAANNESIFETELADVVTRVSKTLFHLASPDEDIFEQAIAQLDARVLSAVRKFFAGLDEAGATLRIVERDRDYRLGLSEIHLGKVRTEATTIVESEAIQLSGYLMGMVPQHKKFEFRRDDTNEVIYGTVAADLAKIVEEGPQTGFDYPPGNSWRAEFSVREVSARNAPTRKFYTLKKLLERL